jgi:hypothetical protein
MSGGSSNNPRAARHLCVLVPTAFSKDPAAVSRRGCRFKPGWKTLPLAIHPAARRRQLSGPNHATNCTPVLPSDAPRVGPHQRRTGQSVDTVQVHRIVAADQYETPSPDGVVLETGQFHDFPSSVVAGHFGHGLYSDAIRHPRRLDPEAKPGVRLHHAFHAFTHRPFLPIRGFCTVVP